MNSNLIIFNGIITRNKIPHLSFKNEQDSQVEVPIDPVIAKRISDYLVLLVSKNSEGIYRESEDQDDDHS